jgi:CheY-like chemotaxis protein
LSNFISNAVKFTEHGNIDIVADIAGDAPIRITVRDTGIGIDPAVLPNLFTPFKQADSSTARRFGGTGLGLAISRRIAEAMGGRVGAESHAGSGSSFWVELPLPRASVDDLAPPPEAPPEMLRLYDGSRPCVLVADDIEATRTVAEAHLAAVGCDTVAVADGAAALAAMAQRHFDAVLMDSNMPVLDGGGAIDLMRFLPAGVAARRVVAFSASTSEPSTNKLSRAGIDAALAKPFSRKSMLAVLGPLLLLPAMPPAAAAAPLLAQLPAAARKRLAASVHRDLPRLSGELAAALAGNDSAAAARVLHAIKGLAGSIGEAVLAQWCSFGEQLLVAVAPEHCRWIAAVVAGAAAEALVRIDALAEPEA